MSNLKMERLKILSRINEAIGQGDLEAADRHLDALLNNTRPSLNDGENERVDKFLKKLDEEYKDGLAKINADTKDLKPLDRNAARRMKYARMEEYRTAELYSFLVELVSENHLVPMGDARR